ncbi:MAG: ATP-binding protein [Alphaproteobacteria bacterium]|nr:ATP-binding protein [Alphaproteobacteria bacterium]
MRKPLKIKKRLVIASGKGGTGKTMISASLSHIWDSPVCVADVDVEEPNLHLFLNPDIQEDKKIFMKVPVINQEKCNLCGACSDICQFNVIAIMGKKTVIFPEMCHGCDGCFAVCPNDAIIAGKREIGVLSWGNVDKNAFVTGCLRIGEAMSPPLMKAVLEKADSLANGRDMIIDAPPGTSCPAMTAAASSDFILLVTEPTPFGLNDLRLAVEAFSVFGVKMGVVVNRSGIGDRSVYEYCNKSNLPIFAEIPFDINLAKAYSRGEIISSLPEYKTVFKDLAVRIKHCMN